MTSKVVVYQLRSKFVNQREDIPDDARQVVYYSLAVGHHVGVMDCFSSIMEIPMQEYCALLERLPKGSERNKLEGVLKWGEIEINRSHVGSLLPALEASGSDPEGWVSQLIPIFRGMMQEPAIYLMLRKRT